MQVKFVRTKESSYRNQWKSIDQLVSTFTVPKLNVVSRLLPPLQKLYTNIIVQNEGAVLSLFQFHHSDLLLSHSLHLQIRET